MSNDKPMRTLKWGPDRIIASIIMLGLLGYEAFVLLIGPALIVCYTLVPGQALTCMQFERAASTSWDLSSAQQILTQLTADGFVANPVAAANILSRLPNIGVSVATIILALMGATPPAGAFTAWVIQAVSGKPTSTVRTPPKGIDMDDMQCLREELNRFLKEHGISRTEFGRLAKVDITTLSGFLDNTRDTREAQYRKICTAFQGLQNKTDD